MKRKIAIPILLLLSVLVCGAQSNIPAINVVGIQDYCDEAPLPIVNEVYIFNPGGAGNTLDEVVIQISEGYANGFDTLSLSQTQPGITSQWNPDLGQLILTGPATANQFEQAILAVRFNTTQTIFTSNRSFSVNIGGANYLPTTQHYYSYISDPGVSWLEAKQAAENQSYFGLQGYLATLTTPEEGQLAGAQSPGVGWIGASDAETESVWKWVTGPENGTIFWQGAVSGTPVNNEYSFWNAGEPNNFGDEDYAHITDPSIGILGSWNDLEITGSLNQNSPYYPKGYFVEFGGMPGDPQINLSDSSEIKMPIFTFEDKIICQGETVELLVSSNTDEVIWYEDEDSNTIINQGDTYNVQLNETTTFWISGQFNSCSNNIRIPLVVTVNPLPIANAITIQQCDDNVYDGLSFFRLNDYEEVISNGNTSNVVVSFFDDQELGNPINALNYFNTSNNQIVYAKVEDIVTNCYDVAMIDLVVSTAEPMEFEFFQCEDDTLDGKAQFDLNEMDDIVLQGLPPNLNVSYFKSIEDTLLNQSPIPNTYENNIPGSEIIYARVYGGLQCYGIYPIKLIVINAPILEMDESIFYCLNQYPETITLYPGVENSAGYQFLWSTGETTPTIEVNETGLYTVEVTNVQGCTSIRQIDVLPSNTAIIEEIEITDFSEVNSVLIAVSGEGEYEYSLSSAYGPYQSSNFFNNVKPGLSTVYIRDIKANCGVVSQSFDVIGFSKYFTPNGDGVNDFWQLKGLTNDATDIFRVTIFDRYGKALAVLTSNKPYWDGTFNGRKMPTADYWFVAELNNGRTFTKHFTLKR